MLMNSSHYQVASLSAERSEQVFLKQCSEFFYNMNMKKVVLQKIMQLIIFAETGQVRLRRHLGLKKEWILAICYTSRKGPFQKRDNFVLEPQVSKEKGNLF